LSFFFLKTRKAFYRLAIDLVKVINLLLTSMHEKDTPFERFLFAMRGFTIFLMSKDKVVNIYINKRHVWIRSVNSSQMSHIYIQVLKE